jgi:hypothetical protein
MKTTNSLRVRASRFFSDRHQIHSYSALLRQIHNDLRVQNPEWIQPNGDSPLCDSYEARLMKLLDASIGTRANETTAVPGC